MDTKKTIEERVRKYGGEFADEILEAVKALAEVDMKIKETLDEIERLDDELVQRHNELADKINGLVEKSVEANGDAEPEEKLALREEADQKSDMTIKVEIRVTKITA